MPIAKLMVMESKGNLNTFNFSCFDTKKKRLT